MLLTLSLKELIQDFGELYITEKILYIIYICRWSNQLEMAVARFVYYCNAFYI